jgi:hypothetical protein
VDHCAIMFVAPPLRGGLVLRNLQAAAEAFILLKLKIYK